MKHPAILAALILVAGFTYAERPTTSSSPTVVLAAVPRSPEPDPPPDTSGSGQALPQSHAPSLAAAIDAETIRNEGIDDYIKNLPPIIDPIDRWENGYRESGAPVEHLDKFLTPGGIIDCESGRPDRADWVTVVSGTRDVGPAQINMAVHGSTIEARWPDLDAVASMQDPWRNGFFAGLLVTSRNGVGDWYMSRHCHGYR